MNLQTLKLKASTLCAGGTLLVFGGFLTVNLAGCGGGGGGGISTIPTPSPVGATFRIVQQDSAPSKGGTISLVGNGKTFNGTADNNGIVVLGNVPPGNYTATFTAINRDGIALPATTRPITITRMGAQNYLLVQGDNGAGAFTITGTIFQNPNDNDFTNCTSASTPISANVLISVRDLNDTTGAPIIAQIIRPTQDSNPAANLKGRYTISLPIRPTSFRVEVSPADNNGVAFAGISATTTFTQGNNTLDQVDICANRNGKIPVPFSPTATPTAFPTGGGFPVATSTPLPTATTDPKVTPQATNTTVPTATPTQAGNTAGTTTLSSTAGNPTGGTATTTTGGTATSTTSTGGTATTTTGGTGTGGNSTSGLTTSVNTNAGSSTSGLTTGVNTLR